MKYRANPVIVDAFKIVSVSDMDQFHRVHCATDDGLNRIADGAMTARYHPKPNDYWVIQEDGYEYLNPADVFERKYSLVVG